MFRLQERNYGFGATIIVTLCNDESGIVSIGHAYTDDGWTANAIKDTKHVATVEDPQHPPRPTLSRSADGRITYKAPIRIASVMHSVRDPRFGGMMGQITPLPNDPHQLPELCFDIYGGGFTTFWKSNAVVLPREAIISVFEARP